MGWFVCGVLLGLVWIGWQLLAFLLVYAVILDVGLGVVVCLLFTSVWFVNSVVLLLLLFGYVVFLLSVTLVAVLGYGFLLLVFWYGVAGCLLVWCVVVVFVLFALVLVDCC